MTLMPQGAAAEALRRQRMAADPSRSAWVAASAGTGKTKVLTDRVLNLLLAGTPPERLLCLTFTKAAAAEMSGRIADTLACWAAMPEPGLVGALGELAGEAPSGDGVRAARRLFARVLDAPGGMRIQTIHAFCQSLLARFPLEARLAPHFKVAEEATARELLTQARQLTFAAAPARPEIAQALGVAAVEVQEEHFAELIGKVIAERARFARALQRHGGVDGLTRAVAALLEIDPGLTADAATASACEDAAVDGARLRAAVEVLLRGGAKDRTMAEGIAAWLGDPTARVRGMAAYRLALFTKEGNLRKLAPRTAADHPDVAAVIAAEAERLQKLDDICGRIAVARATAALYRLAEGILCEYKRLKSERALLDYDDLILAARDLLRREGQASWVLYKLDGGIDHILIDEAQDTNPEQWEVVAALAEEFFAGAGARALNRTVFAVGDVKQSIFSFQRADPAAFQRMRRHFRERALAAESGFMEVPLIHSFRSAPAILQAVDAVFARSPAREGVVPEGVKLEHQPMREGAAGLVELWPLPEPPARAADDPWAPPLGRRYEQKPRKRLAKLLARRIQRMTAGGEILESRGRPIRPADVMVLVRRRSDFVDMLVKELKGQGVPVAGVDRMVLMDQLAIQDLAAFGAALLLPEDDLTLACVLKSPLIGLDEDQLFRLAHGRSGRLWRALSERRGEPEFAPAHALIARFLDKADFSRPYELYAELLGPEGGRRRLLERLGPEAADPIEEFLSRALAYEREHAASLQGFLAWLGSGGIEIKRELDRAEGDNGAVRIMTVHGAKGLQAPIVFLPDTTQAPRSNERLLWRAEDDLCLWVPVKDHDGEVTRAARTLADQRDEEEERRLLYVAMTRAEDRLIVCGWRDQNVAPASWHALVAAGLDGVAEPAEFDFTADGGWSGPGLRLHSAQTAPVAAAAAAREAAALAPEPDWLLRAAPEEPDPPKPLAPSRPVGAEQPVRSPLGEDQGRAFRRGRLVHRLLETLPELPIARRRLAAAEFLDAAARDLSREERAEILGETLAVLEHPAFAALWSAGSLAEVPVVGRIEGTVIAGRIDRLVVEEGRVTILDYKTNRPAPTRPEEVAPAYLAQMAAYRRALAEIYPGAEIRCALLWTDGPRVMELPAAFMDRASP